MIKFLGFLAGAIAAVLLAGFVLADPVWGDDHFNYKNPWKPTKNVDKIRTWPRHIYKKRCSGL